jgi:hypothetical protein
MVFAKERAQALRSMQRTLHNALVEIITEDIHAVRCRQIIEIVSIQISYHYAGGGFDKRACSEVIAHEAAVLERNPIGVGELKVGDVGPDLVRRPVSLSEPVLIELGKAHKSGAAAFYDFDWRIIRAKDAFGAVIIVGNERGQESRYRSMIA